MAEMLMMNDRFLVKFHYFKKIVLILGFFCSEDKFHLKSFSLTVEFNNNEKPF